MKNLITIIKKEFLELVRSKKLLILIILFGFIAISSPIIAKLIPTLLKNMPATPGLTISLPDPTWNNAIDQLVKNISQIAMIIIMFMFAGTVADEKNKKTLEITLTKPISRTSFILGKYLANFGATKIIFILASALFYLYTTSLFSAFSLINFVLLTIFMLIYLMVICALTIFFSTINTNPIVAVAQAFFVEIIFATAISYFKKAADYSPTYVLSNYKILMEQGNYTDFLPSAIISIVIIIFFVLLSIFLFQRQEVER